MNKTYTVIKFEGRVMVGKYQSYQKAASVLRTLNAEYFIQGPRQAWFYADVAKAA